MVHYDKQCNTYEFISGGFTLICFSLFELREQVLTIYGINIDTILN